MLMKTINIKCKSGYGFAPMLDIVRFSYFFTN